MAFWENPDEGLTNGLQMVNERLTNNLPKAQLMNAQLTNC